MVPHSSQRGGGQFVRAAVVAAAYHCGSKQQTTGQKAQEAIPGVPILHLAIEVAFVVAAVSSTETDELATECHGR
jgi:hypothetical protein